MSLSSGHWYAVLSARELGSRPVGRMRFGERLVFWRDEAGRACCVRDRCAHRGAALSLGRVREGRIECPFHGFCYDRSGQCVRVPVERQADLAAGLRVEGFAVTESDGYVWLWRGPAEEPDRLPPAPPLAPVAGLAWGETHYPWEAHYTRCIENVLDYSHLPFVHRTTLGRRIRDPVCAVAVDPLPGGFRARMLRDSSKRQFIELVYPNVWLNGFGGRFALGAAFVPVDDRHTETYVRWYHPPGLRAIQPLVDALGRLAQYLVFRDDLPIVASQQPRNVDSAATSDRLVPSDAAIIEYRRLRRSYQQEHKRLVAERD
jgi:phenylpropionate dioxygenase-like ring-hydroxylating dioxygenase large terminal subunit